MINHLRLVVRRQRCLIVLLQVTSNMNVNLLLTFYSRVLSTDRLTAVCLTLLVKPSCVETVLSTVYPVSARRIPEVVQLFLVVLVAALLPLSMVNKYTVELPTHNGEIASFNGVSLPVITGAMPPYPMKEARKVIVEDFVRRGGKERDIPGVPTVVGGETDFLIGIMYNWYQPRLVHILPSGFAIYKSMHVPWYRWDKRLHWWCSRILPSV